MRPVLAGMWQQHQVWDGTYNVDDLLDAHEMLDIKEETTRRLKRAEENLVIR